MSNTLRDIKRRIKAVKNTKQITKTMEMVSAGKMRKAQIATIKSRYYAEKAMEILVELSEKMRLLNHPLFEKRNINHTTVLLITSDRGLCGGYNLGVINKMTQYLKGQDKCAVSIITVGIKGRDVAMRLGFNISADFSQIDRSDFRDSLALSQFLFDSFLNRNTDQVLIAYSHFINTMKQKPVIKPLLPLSKDSLNELIAEIKIVEKTETVSNNSDFLIEPNPKDVFDALIPRLSEIQIYQAILEADASEHSARMVAMKSATDAASDIINDLTLLANQIRQSGITAEISEIVSAGEAMND